MGKPKPPDPMQTVRQQQTFNRESQADASQLGQIGQDTPWGSTSYTGEIGSPDRRQTVTLNPQDQARLDQERSIKSRLLGIILGGSQGMQGGQGKQGGGQPMPAMGMGQGQGPQPGQQQVQQALQQVQQQMPPPQQPMGPMGPTGQYGDPTNDEMMARYMGMR